MKKALAFLLCLLMVTALFAGCSQTPAADSPSDPTENPPEGGTGEAAEVLLWHFPIFDGAEQFFAETVADAVKAKYSNVTLKTEMLSWDAGPERLTVAMATGATPDLIIDGQARLNPGIFAGLCADITDLREELAPMMYEGYDEIGLVDGKYYYIPTGNSNGYVFIVNTDLAKELGVYDLLPEDRTHWSYDDFLEFCRKAREAGKSQDAYPVQLYAGSRSSDAAMYSFLMCGGMQILNDDQTKMAVNSPETAASLNLLKQLIDEELVPQGAATTKDEDVASVVHAGRTVLQMTAAGAQNNITVQRKADSGEIEFFNTDTCNFPTPDGKADPHVANWGTSGMVVFRNANDAAVIEGAKNVIRTLYTDIELLTALNSGMGTAPTNKDVFIDYGYDYLNELAERANEWNGKYSDSGIGILEPWWSDWRETFYVELQEFYVGNQTAEQMLENWTAKGNAVIQSSLENS